MPKFELVGRPHINDGDQNNIRLLVIRGIANDPLVLAAARNRTFVTMEYIGYLRRTPDLGGFNFWLNIINQQPTNENGMVCAFITSAEYQRRFSTVVTRTNAECGGMPNGPDGPPKDDSDDSGDGGFDK